MSVSQPADQKAAAQLIRDHLGHDPTLDPDGLGVSAEWHIGSMDRCEGAALRRKGRWLLDMWTTYEFEERIELSERPLTPRGREVSFAYEIEMPGRIVEAEPDGAIVHDGTARWMLTASDLSPDPETREPFTVKATSRQFKCGNATVMLYVALWAIGWVGLTVYRRVRGRPRRI